MYISRHTHIYVEGKHTVTKRSFCPPRAGEIMSAKLGIYLITGHNKQDGHIYWELYWNIRRFSSRLGLGDNRVMILELFEQFVSLV